MTRALIIQLARLGDLLQTAPAIASLTARHSGTAFDLLCPAHLAEVGRLLPGIQTVLGWDGGAWRRRAASASACLDAGQLHDALRHIETLVPVPYDRAYVLNQHPRALLAAALLARATTGPRLGGPLDERLTPWAGYVREVARTRRGRRVHLADVFCGLCGVPPPGRPIAINAPVVSLPADLASIGKQAGPWVALIVGAGDAERMVPVPVWQEWSTRFLTRVPRGRIVLVGEERERGRHIQEALPPSLLGRMWDATGRTSLPQLAAVLRRCHTAIGADTGPLHLAAALGTHVIGWYFARARVHETGPYGPRHLVWQAGRGDESQSVQPDVWPVGATVEALVTGAHTAPEGWSLWIGQCDRWGAFYSEAGREPQPPQEREALWHELHQAA